MQKLPLTREQFKIEMTDLCALYYEHKLCNTIAGNTLVFQRKSRELGDRLAVYLNLEYRLLNEKEQMTHAEFQVLFDMGIEF